MQPKRNLICVDSHSCWICTKCNKHYDNRLDAGKCCMPIKKCEYGAKTDCHCNICLDKIDKMYSFKKREHYWYNGRIVEISSICPLEHCSDFFIIDSMVENGFSKWLSNNKAREVLVVVTEDELKKYRDRQKECVRLNE